MDPNESPPDDRDLPGVVSLLVDQARHPDIEERRAAIERLYELAYKVGPKIAQAIPVLVDGLFDPDEKIGESALWALNYCKPDSIDPLIDCLAHHKAFVRERAAHSLGNIGDEARRAAPTLRDLLLDVEQPVRRRAAWALGLVHDLDLRTINVLMDMAKRGSAVDKAAALHALGNIGKSLDDPSVLGPHQRVIMSALDDVDSDVRWSALYATGSLGLAPQPTADLMISILQREQSSRVIEAALSRLKAVAAMVDLTSRISMLTAFVAKPGREASLACEVLSAVRPPPQDAVQPLIKALQVDELVLPATTALWKIDPQIDQILPALERIFDDYDESVCDVICELGPAAAPLVPKLIEAISSENWDLQWAAADALGAVASSEAGVMAALLDALGHPSPIVRSASARALASVGAPAVAALSQLIGDAADQRVAWGAYALGEMGPVAATALPELRAGMRGMAEPLSSSCAIAVARISGDAECIPYLVGVLRSADSDAPRRSAASALAELGSAASEAIDALEALSDDEDPEVVAAAEGALIAIRAPMQ